MAFISEENDPNKQKPSDVQTRQAPGAGPTGGGGGGGKATPQSTPTQPFQNFSAYLNANQPQVAGMAGKLASDLTSQYGQTQQNINQARDTFNNQVQGGYAAPNEDLVNQAATNPTDFASNPNNVKAFQSLYNDTYSGPDAFESQEGYGDIANAVTQGTQRANQVSTIPGLQTYFQGLSPNITKGGSILDAALLRGNPEAVETVRGAAAPFADLVSYLGSTSSQANTAAQNAKQTAEQTRNAVQNQFTGDNGIIPGFKNTIGERLANAKTSGSSLADSAISRFSNGNPTAEDLKILGFDTNDMTDKALSNSWQQAQNLSRDYNAPTNWQAMFTKQSPDTIFKSPGMVSTPEEITKANALQSLTGQDLSSWLGDTGTPNNMVDVNRSGLGNLGTDLTRRDQEKILQYATPLLQVSDWGGNPAPSWGDFQGALNSNYDTMLNRIKSTAPTLNDPVLLHALARAGLYNSSAPTEVGGGGHVSGYI